MELEKKKMTILVSIEVETTKSSEAAFDAIKKGIYWGLDTKKVASPDKVNVFKRTN